MATVKPVPFAAQPGWRPIAEAYAQAWRAPKPIAPVPGLDDATAAPLLHFLTDPADVFSAGPYQAFAEVRPYTLRQHGTFPWSVSMPWRTHTPLTDALDHAEVCAVILEGAPYIFSTTQPLPEDVATAMIRGLKHGWLQPIVPSTVRAGKKSDDREGVTFAMPALPTQQQAPTLDVAEYLLDRQCRWARPLTANPELDWKAPTYAWLADYPELASWLRDRATRIEPQDLRLLHGFITQLARPQQRLTLGQVHALRGMIQGVLGEIAHRQAVVERLWRIHTLNPDAILICERELAAPRGLSTSDAVIGTIDPATNVITLHAVYEITSAVEPGTASEQMQRSVHARFVEHGLTIVDHAGRWRTFGVHEGSAEPIIVPSSEIMHERLAALAEDTANAALNGGRIWMSAIQPEQQMPKWMSAPMWKVVEAVVAELMPHAPISAEQFIQALEAQLIPHRHIRLALERVIAVARNMYCAGEGARIAAKSFGSLLGASRAMVGKWEKRLNRLCRPLGLIEEAATLQGGSMGNAEALQRLDQMFPPSAGHLWTPRGLLFGLQRCMRQYPKEKKRWEVLITVARNMYAPGDAGRRVADDIAQDLGINEKTVRRWEQQLRACAIPRQLAEVEEDRSTAMGVIAINSWEAWVQEWPSRLPQRRVRRFLRKLWQFAIEHSAEAPVWRLVLATAQNMFVPQAGGRQPASQVAKIHQISGKAVREWEDRLLLARDRWGLQELPIANIQSAGIMVHDQWQEWCTAVRPRITGEELLQALRALAAANPKASLAWRAIIAIAKNMYIPSPQERLTEATLCAVWNARGIVISVGFVNDWTARFRAYCQPRGLIELVSVQGARRTVGKALRKWGQAERAAGHEISTQAIVIFLHKLAALRPDTARTVEAVLAILQNMERPAAERASAQQLATQSELTNNVIYNWIQTFTALLEPTPSHEAQSAAQQSPVRS